MGKQFYVYILAKARNSTFYVGVTSDIEKRIWQHKQGEIEGFTQKHAIKTLVYYEIFGDAENAIRREKRLKKWPREWKMRVIEKMNPDWRDLYEDFFRMPAQGGHDVIRERKMKKTVALLVGGWSSEREVSLMKGKHIESALKESGYTVKTIDVSRDLQKLIKELSVLRPDVVFNNLYGRGGEDGTIQAVLEMLELPYTHSGVVASAIGMDKVKTKIMVESVGVRTSLGRIATKDDILNEAVMPRPYVVKPVNEGSSVGVRIILEGENQKPIDENTWTFGETALVEKYVRGREIHVAVLDGKALNVTEIIVHGHRFFDYEAKYSDTSTELVTPADIPEIVAKTAMDFAARAYNVLGCSGIARVDMRYDDSIAGGDGVYFLEINTMPGLSPGSIAVIQPEFAGLSYVQLCSHLVETAQCQAKAPAAPLSSNAAKAAVSG